MNWYQEVKQKIQIKQATKKHHDPKNPSDIDVNYDEVNEEYVQLIINDIEKLLLNKNLEKIKETVKDNVSKSKDKIFKHYIGKVRHLKVYLVNGNEVKVKKFMDFVEGGNGMIYGVDKDADHPSYVPENELWVDADLDISSFPYVLLHEGVEYFLMRDEDLDYGKAHQRANGVEKTLRKQNHFKVDHLQS